MNFDQFLYVRKLVAIFRRQQKSHVQSSNFIDAPYKKIRREKLRFL